MLDLILIVFCIFLILYVLKYGFIATISLLLFLQAMADGLIGHWKIILAVILGINILLIYKDEAKPKKSYR